MYEPTTFIPNKTKIAFYIDQKYFTVNGFQSSMDAVPFTKDGRTFVPVRYMAQSLGILDVRWDDQKRQVILNNGLSNQWTLTRYLKTAGFTFPPDI